jgi:hypothetical protein
MNAKKPGDLLRERRAERRPDIIQATRQAFARLDRLREEADAGVPQESLALSAGTTKKMVKAWLKERGINTSGSKRLLSDAIDLFGDRQGFPARHQVEAEKGTKPFRPPKFLLREPIRYSGFCAVVQALVAAGWQPSEIASALGFRELDVMNALEIA